jgi:hypothetical protein
MLIGGMNFFAPLFARLFKSADYKEVSRIGKL